MRYQKGSIVTLSRDYVRTKDMVLFGITVPVGGVILPAGSSGQVTDTTFGTGMGMYMIQFNPTLCFDLPDEWLV